MIPVETRIQIDKLRLQGTGGLLICDVDEVIVHFMRDFEAYIADQGFALKVNGFQLSGCIQRLTDGHFIDFDQAHNLVQDFFDERTLHMELIDGAFGAIQKLSDHAEVVFLTNLPGNVGDMRRQNLAKHGLNAPVIVNSGPKGPAVRALAAMAKGPVVFVDDNPGFLASSHEYAPQVSTIHFLHDERFLAHVPALPFLALRCNNWADALAFAQATFEGKTPQP
jgi:hypothetical protein